jgi:hypothetical protein
MAEAFQAQNGAQFDGAHRVAFIAIRIRSSGLPIGTNLGTRMSGPNLLDLASKRPGKLKPPIFLISVSNNKINLTKDSKNLRFECT